MGKTLFIFKELNSDDRDVVNYIERPKFECGHYFGGIHLLGACFSRSLELPKDIKSVLLKEELMLLVEADKQLNTLGHGITKGSVRYKQGLYILEGIEPIFKKLESEENQKLFEEVIQEERQYIQDEIGLTNEEIDEVFDEYYLSYRDRGILGGVFDTAEKLGIEEAENFIENFKSVEKYFDYEAFASDLLNNDNYFELSSGRCVYLSY